MKMKEEIKVNVRQLPREVTFKEPYTVTYDLKPSCAACYKIKEVIYLRGKGYQEMRIRFSDGYTSTFTKTKRGCYLPENNVCLGLNLETRIAGYKGNSEVLTELLNTLSDKARPILYLMMQQVHANSKKNKK